MQNQNFFIASWKGKIELWKFFWIYNPIVFVMVAINLIILSAIFFNISFLSMIILDVLFFCIYILWFEVSLWRCAFNAEHKIWFFISKVNVFLSSFFTIISLFIFIFFAYADMVKGYNKRGLEKLNQNKYEEALKDFNKAVSLLPNDIKSSFNRAQAYFKIKKYSEALKDFEKVHRAQPNNASVNLLIAISKYKLLRYEEALDDLNDILAKNPKNEAGIYAYRAGAKFYLGKYEDAVKDFDQAIELISNYDNSKNIDKAHYYYYRGLSKKNLGLNDLADKDFLESKLLDPNGGSYDL